MQAYFDVLSARAFQEGYDAYLAGKPRRAPEYLLTYSGKYVEGWQAAQIQNFQQMAA